MDERCTFVYAFDCMRLAFVPLAGLASLASIGCAVDGAGEGTGDALETVGTSVSQQSAALVHLERQEGSSHVVARYVRAAQVTAEALRATGGAFELPALGQCSPLEAHAVGTAPLLPVELVAAGSTSLAQSGAIVELVPRSVPDVSDLVSGFVYSKTADLQPGAASLLLAGVAEPIVIEIPPSLDGLTVDGASSAGTLELGALGATVRIGWQALGGSSERLVVADVHGAQSAVRCTFEDNGNGEVESAWFGSRGTLVLRRVLHLELERDPFQRVVIDAETSRTLSYTSSIGSNSSTNTGSNSRAAR